MKFELLDKYKILAVVILFIGAVFLPTIGAISNEKIIKLDVSSIYKPIKHKIDIKTTDLTLLFKRNRIKSIFSYKNNAV